MLAQVEMKDSTLPQYGTKQKLISDYEIKINTQPLDNRKQLRKKRFQELVLYVLLCR